MPKLNQIVSDEEFIVITRAKLDFHQERVKVLQKTLDTFLGNTNFIHEISINYENHKAESYSTELTWKEKALYAIKSIGGGTFLELFEFLKSIDKTFSKDEERANNAIRTILSALKSSNDIYAELNEYNKLYYTIKKRAN